MEAQETGSSSVGEYGAGPGLDSALNNLAVAGRAGRVNFIGLIWW
jgi:hypothetical protein